VAPDSTVSVRLVYDVDGILLGSAEDPLASCVGPLLRRARSAADALGPLLVCSLLLPVVTERLMVVTSSRPGVPLAEITLVPNPEGAVKRVSALSGTEWIRTGWAMHNGREEGTMADGGFYVGT
jgi:hypothetical protein